MSIIQTKDFNIENIDGSASRGGWQVSGSFANAQDQVIYGRHSEIFVLPEGKGAWESYNKEVIDGSMIPATLIYDRKQSALNVTISTSDVFLSNAGLQGIYFSEQPSPANPHQMTDLNLGRIVEHIVNEHTNISLTVPGGWVDTTGIDIVNSTSVDVYSFKQSNSIWSTIEKIASEEFYVRYFTKDDRLIYEQHPQFKASLPPVVLTFDNNNIVRSPEVTYRNNVLVDQTQLYALTDTGQILSSFYPANIGTDGRRQKFPNLRCNSQSRLDVLAERAYKFLNREIDVRLSIGGPWGAYLELYDRVEITYTGTDRNGVTIDWDKKKFWVDSIKINKSGNFLAMSEVSLQEENV